MTQLNLQFSDSKKNLKDLLEAMIGKSLSLVITDNSTSMLSIRTINGSITVRMHRMFLNAGEDIISEIAVFIKTRRGRTPLVRKFISENRTFLKKKARSSGPDCMRTQGRYYNLQEIFSDINKEYFQGSITALISWGKTNVRRVVRKRTLGTYCRTTHTIRINPVLDRRSIPLYFLRYVVYHEMLHSDINVEKKNGRRSVHSPEFRERERLFKEYQRANSWEKRYGT
jgi:hypothetical protein